MHVLILKVRYPAIKNKLMVLLLRGGYSNEFKWKIWGGGGGGGGGGYHFRSSARALIVTCVLHCTVTAHAQQTAGLV